MRVFLAVGIVIALVSAFAAGDGRHARAADGPTIFVDADPNGTLIPGIPDMDELEKDLLHRFPYFLDTNRAHALIDTKLIESAKRRQRIEDWMARLRSSPDEIPIPGVPDLDELERELRRNPLNPLGTPEWERSLRREPHRAVPETKAILRLWT